MFGNERQESSMICHGGLDWWQDNIVVACNDAETDTNELRFYPKSENLDNRNVACRRSQPRPLLFVSVFRDYVLVFSTLRVATIYKASLMPAKAGSVQKVDLAHVWEMDLSTHIISPYNVLSMSLSRIDHEQGRHISTTPRAIIANVSGNLLMFALDHLDSEVTESSSDVPLTPPVLLSHRVENYWLPPYSPDVDEHLMDCLWLHCGSDGMKAWLPLRIESTDDLISKSTVMSKRIMIPFDVNVYPLSLASDNAIVVGGGHDIIYFSSGENSRHANFTLERKIQIYLHHLIRQVGEQY